MRLSAKPVILEPDHQPDKNIVPQDITDLLHYIAFSPTLAMSGQPDDDELHLIRDTGYRAVIHLQIQEAPYTVPEEYRLIREMGLDYAGIPISFSKPTPDNYHVFKTLLNQYQPTPTLVHCAAGYASSVFLYLYRTLEQQIPMAQARADLHQIWEPDSTWQAFIQQINEH